MITAGRWHSNKANSVHASSRVIWSEISLHLTQNHSRSSGFQRSSGCVIQSFTSTTSPIVVCKPALGGPPSPSGEPDGCQTWHAMASQRLILHFGICFLLQGSNIDYPYPARRE